MTDLPTFDGDEPGPGHGHVGWPVDWTDVLQRVKRGLPSYVPGDPRSIDQTVYLEFASKPEGAPK